MWEVKINEVTSSWLAHVYIVILHTSFFFLIHEVGNLRNPDYLSENSISKLRIPNGNQALGKL